MIFFHNQENPSGSHVRVILLVTLKVAIGHFGVTIFACFHHQADNIGLSKNVTVSLDFGSHPEPCSTAELCFLLDHWHKSGLQLSGPVWRWRQCGGSSLTLDWEEGVWGSSSMSLLIPFCQLFVPFVLCRPGVTWIQKLWGKWKMLINNDVWNTTHWPNHQTLGVYFAGWKMSILDGGKQNLGQRCLRNESGCCMVCTR